VCFSLVYPKLLRKDVALIKSRKNGLIVLAPIISPTQFILDFAFRLFLHVINRLEKWYALKALRLFPADRKFIDGISFQGEGPKLIVDVDQIDGALHVIEPRTRENAFRLDIPAVEDVASTGLFGDVIQ